MATRTSTPLDYSPPKRRRLKASQIRYLVFEGGGGKGFAYLGALRALETVKALQYLPPDVSLPPTADGERHSRLDFAKLRGVGGASAGAITAFLLSIGYTPSELAKFLAKKETFLNFFDGGYNDPRETGAVRLVPTFGGTPYRKVEDSDAERQQKARIQTAESLYGFESRLAQLESSLGILPPWIGAGIGKISAAVIKYEKVSPFDRLIPHWKDYVVNLGRDKGLFAGASARDLFDSLLAARMPPGADGLPQKNIPFEAHFQYFNVELLMTGTNILTGKSQVFSHIDTPWVPVADAVRISMGIPFAFKPVEIKTGDPVLQDHPELRGCWVDGGLLNNNPFREFDDRPGANPKTLALRLELDSQPGDLATMSDFLSSYLNLALLGPGESYVTAAHAFQTIVLETGELSLLDFAPSETAVRDAVKAAKLSTLLYFTGNPNKPSVTVSIEEATSRPPTEG